MAVAALKPKNAVESLRDIVQDLLVPELKAIKGELESRARENQTQFDALRTELRLRTDALSNELQTTTDGLRTELKLTADSLRTELKSTTDALRADTEGLRTELRTTTDALRADTEALRTELRIRDEKQTQALQSLSDKLGTLLEVRERLAVLEDRTKRP